jgi:hypothetical protein
LLAVGILAASVWVGSLVAIAVVSAVARRALDAHGRVALFRGVGRAYRYVGTGSLLVGVAVAVVLAWPVADVDRGVQVELGLSALLLAVTLAGMAQAKRMTVLRQRSLDRPRETAALASVATGARVALALRGAIGLVTLTMVVLASHLLAW